MKATTLVESSLYFIFSLDSLCSNDVHRHESGRCCILPFFLTFFPTFPGFPFTLIEILNVHITLQETSLVLVGKSCPLVYELSDSDAVIDHELHLAVKLSV